MSEKKALTQKKILETIHNSRVLVRGYSDGLKKNDRPSLNYIEQMAIGIAVAALWDHPSEEIAEALKPPTTDKN